MTFLGPDLQPPQIWTGATTAHHAATCLVVTKSKDDSKTHHLPGNGEEEAERYSATQTQQARITRQSKPICFQKVKTTVNHMI